MTGAVDAADIADAVLATFDDLVAAVRGQRLYALALVADDGAMGFGLAANTEQAYAAHLAAARAEDADLTPQDEAWYRWSIGEWRHEGWRHDLFAGLNRRLAAAARDADESASSLPALVEAMTVALVQLRVARPAALADTVLFVTLTDSDGAETVENAAACRANPPALRDRFLARYA